MENKEIIGYKLKDKFDLEEFKELTKCPYFDTEDFEKKGASGNYSTLRNHLENMGVLDLWFTPVYKEENQLEVGKWYKDHDGDLFFVTKWLGNSKGYSKALGYGFCHKEWTKRIDETNSNNYCLKNPTPASDQEIEQALIKESKKRGFKEGVTSIDLDDGKERVLEDRNIKFYKGELLMTNNTFKYCTLFSKGQWAEIISKPELPEIEGIHGLDEGENISYGCKTFNKNALQVLNILNITSFNLKVNGKKIFVSKEQTKQLKEYLNQ